MSIVELEKILSYCFKDKMLLVCAVTHTSYANDVESAKSYERLEFLGDAVLQILASDYIYRIMPENNEGDLTQKRVAFVCENSLALCARNLNIGEYLLLGKGEEQSGGRGRKSILADLIESILGAVYIDGGLEEARSVFERIVLPVVKDINADIDHKSELLQIVQKDAIGDVSYRCISESGPDHNKSFVCQVLINGKVKGEGEGRTKKAAQQEAAGQAIKRLQVNIYTKS